jgi:hypothetical protein
MVSCNGMPAGIHIVILHLNQFFSLFFRFLLYQLFLCASLDIQLPVGPASKMPPFQACSIQDIDIPSMAFIVIK